MATKVIRPNFDTGNPLTNFEVLSFFQKDLKKDVLWVSELDLAIAVFNITFPYHDFPFIEVSGVHVTRYFGMTLDDVLMKKLQHMFAYEKFGLSRIKVKLPSHLTWLYFTGE